MKDGNRIWFLMGKKLSSSIKSNESEELEILLAANAELWYSYELLLAVISLDDVPEEFINEIKSLLEKHPNPEIFNNLIIDKLNSEHSINSRHSSQKHKKYIYTAGILFFLALTWLGISHLNPNETEKSAVFTMNKIVAPKGSKTQISLSDGTIIWLNAGSKLIYPKNFNLENRVVFLTGEAYFKVRHYDKHAFIVRTSQADIKDLGTTFNVKAYLGSPTTETTLIEGSVEVKLKKNPSRKILIEPNEKLTLYNKPVKGQGIANQSTDPVFEISKIVPFSKTNEIVETAWVSNKLIFRDERFEDLAREMERRYNVNIVMRSDVVNEYHFTGIFKNENIVEALQLLQVITPFKFKISDEEIIIDK